MPKLSNGATTTVRKVVVKVPVREDGQKRRA
jgi:hypothetical protein